MSINIRQAPVVKPIMRPIADADRIRQLVRIDPTIADFSECLVTILVETSSIFEGHFELLAGQHSSVFLRFGKIASHPRFVRELAEQAVGLIKRRALKPDLIASRDRAGQLLGWEIGRALGVEEIIIARTDANRRPVDLVNGSGLCEQSLVLIVDDMITSGDGIVKLKDLIEDRGARVIDVAVFGVRENFAVPSLPFEPIKLADLLVGRCTWGTPGEVINATRCDICKSGLPLVKSSDLA